MQYDLIVIGGGPGGYVAAIRASQLGMKTALIEKNQLGGTCLYRELQESSPLGLTGTVHCDFSAMQQRKNEVTAQLRGGIEQLLQANQVTVYQEKATILDGHTVQAGEQILTGRYLLIASGSVPAMPPIPGADLPGVVTSDTLLEQDGIDCQRLLIVGGGVIGVEMASIYAALGKEVTIVEAAEKLLPPMDREISQNLAMILKKRGITIYTNALVSEIKQVEADCILLSVGRRPCTNLLFGEEFSVAQTEKGFVAVDEQFRTSEPSVYAIGDVIGRIQLAHAAEAQGIAAVEFMNNVPVSVRHDLVPSCVYTTPEIASVGITADEAKKEGRAVITGKYVMSGNAKTIIEQQDRGFVKLVFDEKTEVLLGAQLMCARATDLISELTTAIATGLTRAQLAHTLRPHPTFCEGITEAAEGAIGQSIHTMPPKKRV